MKQYRGTLLAAAVLLAALPLSGCGNALEGGSGPSGSYIRVTGVSKAPVGEVNVWMDTSHVATVALTNESAPNALEPTNSRVELNRYRVEFTCTNRSGVSIPAIGGAETVSLAAGAGGAMRVLVMDSSTIDYIRSNYPAVGNGDSLTLRATITIWGEDAFKVTVSVVAQTTFVVGGTPVIPEVTPVPTASIKTQAAPVTP